MHSRVISRRSNHWYGHWQVRKQAGHSTAAGSWGPLRGWVLTTWLLEWGEAVFNGEASGPREAPFANHDGSLSTF